MAMCFMEPSIKRASFVEIVGNVFKTVSQKKKLGVALLSLKTVLRHVFEDMFLKVEINFKN